MFGNVTKSGSAPWPVSGSYTQSNNRYSSAAFSYDVNGRLTNDTFDTLGWDINGNLIKQSGTSIVYDAFDSPVMSGNTQYLYAPDGSLVATANNNGAIVEMFVPLPMGRAVYSGGSLNHYDRYDWQGSARVASTPAQALYSDTSYDAFGIPYWSSGTVNSQYAGLNSDISSGSEQVSLTRRYHPTQGRWISPDSVIPDIYDPQSFNAYHYALNQPTNTTDPGGDDELGDLNFAFGSSLNLLNFGTQEQTDRTPPAPGVDCGFFGCTSNRSDKSSTQPTNPAVQVAEDTAVGGAKGLWNNYGASLINLANNSTNALISPLTSFRFPLAGEYEGSTPGEQSAMAGVFLGSLLTGTGEAKVAVGMGGSYAKLSKLATVGDEIIAHHMPQAALKFTSRAEGGAVTMGTLEHQATRTWGRKGFATAKADAGLSFRSVLAKDIHDMRSNFGTKYNQGIKELLQYYRQNFPNLMTK